MAADVANGLYFVARVNNKIAGVMKFELEDPVFWPELAASSSAFVHKLTVRRTSAKQGVSTALLTFAKSRAAALGRPMLRLDCVADRAGLRQLYEGFGFSLHSTVQKGAQWFARYELATQLM